jgi:hypothetical protein
VDERAAGLPNVAFFDETAEKPGTGSRAPFRGNRFVAVATRRPGERPDQRRISASTGSRPAKSTFSGVSDDVGTTERPHDETRRATRQDVSPCLDVSLRVE